MYYIYILLFHKRIYSANIGRNFFSKHNPLVLKVQKVLKFPLGILLKKFIRKREEVKFIEEPQQSNTSEILCERRGIEPNK